MSERAPEQYEPVLGRIDTQLRIARQHDLDQQLLLSQPAEGMMPRFQQQLSRLPENTSGRS